MELYDSLISGVLELLDTHETVSLPIGPQWTDVGKDNMVFRQDMAFELGGSGVGTSAIGLTAVTKDPRLVDKDEILLVGKDICDIVSDVPYARISLVRVAETAMTDADKLYSAIKKIEFVRYHVSPRGFMSRISLVNKRESARVSRDAVSSKLSFSHVGTMMHSEFHKNPVIERVKTIFITDPAFPFDKLGVLRDACEKITSGIDHVLKSAATDCSTCSLQSVCDEVDGLRELHFGMKK